MMLLMTHSNLRGAMMNEGTVQRSGARIRQLAGLLAGMALIMAIAPASDAQSTGAAMSETDAAAATAAIASQVKTEIDRLPPTSAPEEFEASILFVVGQSEQSPTIICAAFDKLKLDSTVPGNAKTAMDNVCRTIRRQRGTGAIPGGNSGSFGPSGFSSPIVTLGGGSGYATGN